MISNLEYKWLVKSDNKIVGPYSIEQLEELLRKKQISLIDEIRDMDRRWSYIREVPELRLMVEDIRKDIESKTEPTRTLQTGGGVAGSNTTTQTNSETVTSTMTNTSTQDQEDTRTLRPTDIESEVNQVFEKLQNNPQDQNTYNKEIPAKIYESPELSKEPRDPKKHYIHSPSLLRTGTAGAKVKTFLIYFTLALFLFGAGGVASYFYKTTTDKEFEQFQKAQIKKYHLYGQDDLASNVFKNLSNDLKNKFLPEIISLIPELSKKGLINADRIIPQLLQNPLVNYEGKSELELIQFNNHFEKKNIDLAKASLIQAKSYSPASAVVNENEAIFNYFQNDFQKSADLFKELFKNNNKGRYLLGQALTLIAKEAIEGKPVSESAEILSQIERYLITRIDYRKELIFVAMQMSYLKENKTVFNEFKKMFFETPAQLSRQFKLPVLVQSALYQPDFIFSSQIFIEDMLSKEEQRLLNIHVDLEKGFLESSNTLSADDEKKFTLEHVNDLKITKLFLMQKYIEVIDYEKKQEGKELSHLAHLFILRSKKLVGANDLDQNVNRLIQEKNLIGTWAALMQINSSDKAALRQFIQMNDTNTGEFKPFLEAKGGLD